MSESGIGGASTERQAIQQAVNSYFNRRDERETAKLLLVPEAAAPLPVEDPVIRPVGRAALRVAVDSAGMKALLQEAAADEGQVLITGKKVNGDRYAVRRIKPFAIREQRGGRFGFTEAYLQCEDVSSGESRTFRMDGIERVEACA